MKIKKSFVKIEKVKSQPIAQASAMKKSKNRFVVIQEIEGF